MTNIGSESLPVPIIDYDEDIHGTMAREIIHEGLSVMLERPGSKVNERSFQDSDSLFLLERGKWVGTVSLQVPKEKAEAEIHSLFVDKDVVQNKRGASRALTSAVISLASSHGIEKGELLTLKANTRLAERYEALAGGRLEKTGEHRSIFITGRGYERFEVTRYVAHVAEAAQKAMADGGSEVFEGFELVYKKGRLGFPDEGPRRIQGLLEAFLDGEKFRVGITTKGIGIQIQRREKYYLLIIMDEPENHYFFIEEDGTIKKIDEHDDTETNVSDILESSYAINLTDSERTERIIPLFREQNKVEGKYNEDTVILEKKTDGSILFSFIPERPDEENFAITALINENGEVKIVEPAREKVNPLLIDQALRYLTEVHFE